MPGLSHHDRPMAEAMTPLIAVEWDRSGKSALAKLGLDPDEWKVTDPNLRGMIQGAALDFCSETNRTTERDLREALQRVRDELAAGLIGEGEEIEALTKRVQGVFTQAETWRARRIAATEAARAYHAAQERSALDSGVVAGWEWLISGDACNRCMMVAAEARRVRANQAFAVVGDHPKYSQVRFPPLHPYCQCSVMPVLLPEYGGPAEVDWAATLVQPNPGDDYKPPAGKAVPVPKPAGVWPKVQWPEETHPIKLPGVEGPAQPPPPPQPAVDPMKVLRAAAEVGTILSRGVTGEMDAARIPGAIAAVVEGLTLAETAGLAKALGLATAAKTKAGIARAIAKDVAAKVAEARASLAAAEAQAPSLTPSEDVDQAQGGDAIARRRAKVADAMVDVELEIGRAVDAARAAKAEMDRLAHATTAADYEARQEARKRWLAASERASDLRKRKARLDEWETLVALNPRVIPALPMADRLAEYTDGDRKIEALKAIGSEGGTLEVEATAALRVLDELATKIRKLGGKASAKDLAAFEEAKAGYAAAKERIAWARADARARAFDAIRAQDPMKLVAKPGDTSINGEALVGPSAGLQARVDEAMAWLGQVLDRGGSAGTLEYFASEFASGKGRAYAYGGGTGVALDPTDSVKTVIHEVGHVLEYKVELGGANLHRTVREFLKHRVGDEPLRKLKDVVPGKGYRDDEEGREDRFRDAFGERSAWYVGKHYPDATEVLSMGLEEFYADPVGFAAKDPEFTKFLLGVLDGSLR